MVEDIERLAGLGYTDLALPWPRDEQPFAGDLAVIEQLAHRLGDCGELIR